MDPKQQALEYIRTLASQGHLTREEVLAAYDAGSPAPFREASGAALTKKLGAAEIMYGIGGAIIFLGISIFLWQNWEALNTFTRIFSTLGSGIVAYMLGVFFGRWEKTEGISSAFYLVSALVLPTGLGVAFHEAGMDVGSSFVQMLISFTLFAMFLASYVLARKTVFVLFSILFGTWLFYAVTGVLLENNSALDWWKFIEYRTLLSGLTYLCLGYGLSRTAHAGLSGFLYGFGILGFLGAALSLGGWSPEQSTFWELLFPLLVFGALYASVYVRSTAFLTFGTIFLMLYILKITGEYFTGSLGWPLALVVAGLLLIAVGYLSLSIKRKYLKTG